jgi:hypothetical protein
LVVNNTVFVMKNGSDSTGLVQRLDKPFLTIAAARAAALKREKKATAAAARIAGKVAAAERRAADEAAWTEGVRKGREEIEKKIAAVRKAMGVRKNEPNPSAICAMKERMDFEMMCALRKDIYGESFVFL